MSTEPSETQDQEPISTPPAEEPGQEAAEEPTETPAEEGGEEEKPEAKTYTEEEHQAEINRVAAKNKRHLRTENERLKEENARLKGKEEGRKEAQGEQEPPEPTGPPNEGDFENFQDYEEALFDYRYEKRAAQERTANETQTAEQKETARVKKANEDYRGVLDDFKAKTPDFEQVVNREFEDGGPDITPEMAKTLVEGKMPEVFYHLGQNQAESMRIADLPVSQQAGELHRIAGRLGVKPSTPEPAPDVTKAPPPVGGIKGGGGTPKKSYDKMSDAEFNDTRNKEAGR